MSKDNTGYHTPWIHSLLDYNPWITEAHLYMKVGFLYLSPFPIDLETHV